ncbi:unnamed protein product [Ilex paraguariensis]|uniref:Uncharacterized protein n=1 Tax=Ilex paraguariensis TaxID=185542 RepID=A0ABC8S1U0_9AQUA
MSQQPGDNNPAHREEALPPTVPVERFATTTPATRQQQQLLQTMKLLVNQNQQIIQLMLSQGGVAHHPAKRSPNPSNRRGAATCPFRALGLSPECSKATVREPLVKRSLLNAQGAHMFPFHMCLRRRTKEKVNMETTRANTITRSKMSPTSGTRRLGKCRTSLVMPSTLSRRRCLKPWTIW